MYRGHRRLVFRVIGSLSGCGIYIEVRRIFGRTVSWGDADGTRSNFDMKSSFQQLLKPCCAPQSNPNASVSVKVQACHNACMANIFSFHFLVQGFWRWTAAWGIHWSASCSQAQAFHDKTCWNCRFSLLIWPARLPYQPTTLRGRRRSGASDPIRRSLAKYIGLEECRALSPAPFYMLC